LTSERKFAPLTGKPLAKVVGALWPWFCNRCVGIGVPPAEYWVETRPA
jgi:hypothetical protein